MSSLALHHAMLADGVRLRAMRRAFREAVRPGDVVVDLGAGTGILGFLALRAGAGRVYAVERKPILDVAKAIAAENRFDGRVRFVRGDARRVRLPERADLIVSDFVGYLGIDPEMAALVRNARRFLRRGGRFVPERSEVWVAPVEASAAHRRHVRVGRGHGVRVESFSAFAANRLGTFERSAWRRAAPERKAFAFDFARDRAVFPKRARLSFRARGGAIHGLVAIVRTKLSRTVRMDSTFGSHWRPVYLPVLRPIRARAGERIDTELVLHGAVNVEWRIGEQRQSTLFEAYLDGR